MESQERASRADTWAALCLVAGCCIGGGMLAFPVALGVNGFLPSLVVMLFCWFSMTATALLLLEVSLSMEEGVHVVTMTSRLLGPWGRRVSWLVYLFVCYGSLVAYTAGAGAQIGEWWNAAFQFKITHDSASLVFLIFTVGILYFGAHFVGQVNSLFFVIMVVAYFALLCMGVDELQPSLLSYRDWRGIWSPVPLLLTAFSFQTMVPSLVPMLKRDVKALRWAIIGGTVAALIIYLLWQALILGIVPVEGEKGLRTSLEQGVPITLFLREHVAGYWVVGIAEFFGLFAIWTSFLAIGLGLWDFLADGCHLKKQGWQQWFLFVMVALPIALCSTQFERLFYAALELTGAFGDTIINGVFPVMMVWIGRYWLNYSAPWRLFGGKPMLVLVFSAFAIALLVATAMQCGLLRNPQEPYDVVQILNPEQL